MQKLIILVNKMDEAKWSKTRFDEIQAGLTPFLLKTGYKTSDLVYIPIAGLTGDNIMEKSDKCNWYNGPTFMEYLDTVELDQRFPQGDLRIPVLDKMKEKDLIIHGKVENGTITLGDKLALMPSGNPAQVIGLLDGKGQNVQYAKPGENVQIKLNVADEDAVKRGDVICHRDKMMPVTQLFEAEIDVLELLDYKPILSKGYCCIMHIHTYNDEITIKDIIRSEEMSEKGELVVKHKPQYTRSQSKIICRVEPKNPVALEKFQNIPQMGRFTLRDEGKTICVGKVLKYKPYVKGIVGAQTHSAEDLAKKMAGVTITTAAPEMVYDMETGEMKPKKADLGAIAEGEEDE